MNKTHLRRLLLFLVLAASLAAAFWVQGEDNNNADVASAPSRAHQHLAESVVLHNPTLSLNQLGHRDPKDTDIDPFPSTNWFVPPPPPPPALPPQPTAPPLPFQYVGKLEEIGGNTIVYLAKGNESFAISPGDKFDDNYQFVSVEQGQMLITYLPLSIKQRLPIGVPE